MDDIEALNLLRQRKEALKELPTPDDPNISFKKYEEIVSKTMTKTQTDIEKVSKYAKEIIKEFEKSCFRVADVDMDNQLKFILDSEVIKLFSTHCSVLSIPNRNDIGMDDIDMNELEQVQTQQRLAKQQQELMEFIAKTETLISNIESNAALSLSDITGVTDQMKQWCDVLETLEENETRKRKEKEAEERKKRLPMRVYVPIGSHDESLLPTLKFSDNGQKWRSGKSLPEIQLPKMKVSELIP
ncbi:unnamed protein product [Mytilus coruscus]|uniref:Uncharacterized protein n=1 Tax=Mytilus coruscus TaxID=42192 RepID=A0A6J8BEG1_MYTCO|nr:unnamed protein product [Mytilus coruscus]